MVEAVSNTVEHFVEIDPNKCIGCVHCIKVCPMKAIRVLKDNKAHIIDRCIDCGSCVSACPKGAIEFKATSHQEFYRKRYTALTISPVIYTQFGDDVMPNEVILALRRVFDHVFDQAYMHELFNLATQIHIQKNRENPNFPRPLISPICPVVNRLVAFKYPSLLGHLLPFITPRELAARELKRKIMDKSIFKPEEIGIFYLTPCTSKMLTIKSPMILHSSFLDGVIGINEIYATICKGLGTELEGTIYHYSSGIGIGWVKSGGEIAGLEGIKTLAVAGMKETLKYLEKIEMGLLANVDYVEFRTCVEGCIGGQLVAVDKYEAKRVAERLVRMFGIEKRVKYEYVKGLYEQGFFFGEKPMRTLLAPEVFTRGEALRRLQEVEKTLALLPRKDCGACGSPECATFAEDVVNGVKELDECVFLRRPI